MRTVVIVLVVGIFATVGILSVAPFPGRCDVRVGVGVADIGLFVTTYYSITSVSPAVAGQSKIIDWQLLGLGFAPPAISAQMSMTVTLSDGQSSTKVENQFIPSVPVLNGQQFTASDSFLLAYVPFGNYGVNVALNQGGQTVATGSGSIGVGC